MPELPEVETTCRGIAPPLLGHQVEKIAVQQSRLRWPVSPLLARVLPGQTLAKVERRAKYLLLTFDAGTLIAHLGMSGSLRVVPAGTPVMPHDHVDILFSHHRVLRLTDPRRFGGFVWTEQQPLQHRLLKDLGPEPLSDAFGADWLFSHVSRRKRTIKSFLMDSHLLVGVGNIYANEALFLAGIRPDRSCETLTLAACQALVAAVKTVLSKAIAAGGTSLKNFVNSEGEPGWFAIELAVYGRAGQPCTRCGEAVRDVRLHSRSTFFCPNCQC